nr:MAG TPA: Ferredoxin-like domain in Api92-like protein [Caudoviricetes sp.]
MPNWAEGSLKLRGRSENIASALKEMLLNDTVTLENEYDGTLLQFNNTVPYFYISGTRRAFIDQKQIEVWLEEEFCTVELDNFKQAWSAIPENYQEISSKFDVDIKIFAFECGNEFTQEIEISKGEIIKNVCYAYDDYQWEVPFSNLGG